MIKIEDYTIKQYAKMLKEHRPTDLELIKQIDAELSNALSNFGNGQNIGLFLLQKDLLILECKLVLAFLSMDSELEKKLGVRIEKLRKEVEDKTKKIPQKNPYKSFLDWILGVEKYLSFSIDRNNDLLYLVEATMQMLTYYENQEKQINEQNAKRK